MIDESLMLIPKTGTNPDVYRLHEALDLYEEKFGTIPPLGAVPFRDMDSETFAEVLEEAIRRGEMVDEGNAHLFSDKVEELPPLPEDAVV